VTADRTGRARVVVLAGPSGSGKSRLAERLRDRCGWPIVRLDDKKGQGLTWIERFLETKTVWHPVGL
jgi:deoxyadenosine/deoxycytidine kinase